MKSFIFLLLFQLQITLSAQEKKFHLMIDPGHGGNDAGAVSHKTKESDLVLSLAKKIQTLISTTQSEIEVQLTRSQNKYVSLDDRIKNVDPDLYISLHANSSISNQVTGMEVYFQPEQKIKSKNSIDSIVEDLESIGKTKHSHLFSEKLQSQWSLSPSIMRRSGFYVIEKTSFPSVLIEIGFLTNPVEAEKLKTEAYQTQIAETIVNAVLDYKKSVQ